MSRRRLLRVVSSSDEEDNSQQRNQSHSQFASAQQLPEDDEIEEIEVQFEEPLPDIEGVALDSSSGPIPPELIPDDDEDFIDVSDHLSPPSPRPPAAQNTAPATAIPSSNGTGAIPSSDRTSDSSLGMVLQSLGLSLRAEWLESCIRGLEVAVPGFLGLDLETRAKFCFEQFLSSDMNFSGGGALPPNVDSMHLVELPGPFVLQVDEVVNISCSLRQRYQNVPAGPKRCLKLSMTDGTQRVFGMEYRPIKELEVLARAGFKVAIKNVTVRHGLLMLVPEVLEVLGGSVQDLEAARQRLVAEINKPPRGKRTRQGVLPPLAARATRAAWPQNGPSNPVENNTSAQYNNTSTHQDVQDSAPSGPSMDTVGTTGDSVAVPSNGNADELPTSRDTTDNPCTRESTGLSTSGMTTEDNLGPATVQDVQDVEMDDPADPLFFLTGDGELPFTYLACLSAKWVSMRGTTSQVQGKIKGILTGVCGFQYRKRTTFELHAFVDDGSLISRISLHHNVVQKAIGYSPEEVTAAITSSDSQIVDNMKKNLKEFQMFLMNFEGIFLVELSEASDLPIAIEMTHGVPASDAWSLLNRCLTFGQPCSNNRSDPIVLSP